MRRLLIANRSEIACRVMQTARELGIETVAVHSDTDRHSRHVEAADSAVSLGGSTPAESYLNIDKIIAAVRTSGADAVHPGYGFLAENAEFARAVEAAGATFVGPAPEAIEIMGDKVRAREVAIAADVPVVPSAIVTDNAATDEASAVELGFPVLVKAAAGGGGRGMRHVDTAGELATAVVHARREALSAFGDDHVYLEKLIVGPRHIEIQVFGDGNGHVLQLGERECSVQRRHQKIVEEAPSPVVTPEIRAEISACALRLARAMNYRGAGTLEFLLAPDGEFYFLEMNTRLQVEHAVTEMVTSTDLVRWQLEVASGGSLPAQSPESRGHSIECRVYAEDPSNGFLPTAGRVLRVDHPSGVGVRVDSALYDGFDVPIQYDPMLAKVVTWGPDRAQATARMVGALRDFSILGITTNLAFLIEIVSSALFAAGDFTTATVETDYADWTPHDDDELLLAATAAALVLSRPGAQSSREGHPVPAGPWRTLGGWRLGARTRTATADRGATGNDE